jgi:S-adenosylmethionine:tRNA ribosyltransferase-isomerase
MKTNDFYFDLPDNLIAQYPPAERGRGRLMVMDRETRRLEHRMVAELPSILEKGTLAVFNNSRVRKARLLGVSEASGATAEFLLLKKLDDFSWQVLAKRSKRRKPGDRYVVDDVCAEVVPVTNAARGEGSLALRFDRPIDDAWLDIHGHVPLPPYIKRADTKDDSERYQTVYAREHGSAAAPTAGLHFTEGLLDGLRNAGIEITFVTLHVGLGTFLPVRTENIEEHRMHAENYSIDGESALRIEKAKAEGRKILAVGTTSCRVLESAWLEGGGRLKRGEGSTSIFIYPGFDFRVVDRLFTNFHTPFSTLLVLVSAFAGRDFILDSYREAVKEGYRFFSYGDACLIL